MHLSDIPLSSLLVNEKNDRHDDVDTEQEAVDWLLLTFGKRMEKLGEDLASTLQVFEPPIVVEEHGIFRVFDGNRRITAVKLLKRHVNPLGHRQDFWAELAAKVPNHAFASITCQVETDLKQVDQILFRRHNGTNEGIGQNPWDDEARQNFLRRTGQQKKIKPSEVISHFLRLQGVSLEHQMKRSKVDRLFSSRKFQRRFGFEIQKSKLLILMRQDKVVENLRLAVEALSGSDVSLADIWDEERKLRFINSCEIEHDPCQDDFELTVVDAFGEPPALEPVAPRAEKSTRTIPRNCLIPISTSERISWSGRESRLHQVWLEIETSLLLSKHPNASAVMFRVLLDLICVEYRKSHPHVELDDRESLSKRLVAIVSDLKELDRLAVDEAAALTKLIHRQDLLSADALNGWVHDTLLFPSSDHLRQTWNGLEIFVVAAINRIEEMR
ncbi:MAG: hypothetical protein ACU0DW_06090 [Shimia sp.]